MYTCPYTWRPTSAGVSWERSALFFATGVLTALELANYHRMAASKPKASDCLCLPRTIARRFVCGFGGWNSGHLHACKANILQDYTFSQHPPTTCWPSVLKICVWVFRWPEDSPWARQVVLSGQTWVLGTTQGSLQEWQLNKCFQLLGLLSSTSALEDLYRFGILK